MHIFIRLKGGDGNGAPLLISVVKSNKYALLGVLGFDAKGGHITYENTYSRTIAAPNLGYYCTYSRLSCPALHASPCTAR